MVVRFLKKSRIISSCKWSEWLLALGWSAGLFCGIGFFLGSDIGYQLGPISCESSFAGLLMANLLPFLFSAILVYLRLPKLLTVVAFGKGCLFAFISMGMFTAFGSAGWLLRLLVMFSDLFLTVLLYFYWQRHISGMRQFSGLESMAVASAVFLVGSMDYRWVAPILVEII